MIEISHRKAQSFLQSSADSRLSAEDQTRLDAHLEKCAACRAYAQSISDLEDSLRVATHIKWDRQKPKLNYETIISPPATKLIWNNILSLSQGMGKYTIIAALIAGYFLIVNLNNDQISTSGTHTATILPTPNGLVSDTKSPTPTAQLTLTDFQTQICQSIVYVVEASDTLEGIALRYGVAKETILEYNNVSSAQISPGLNLSIPLCESTPSRTASIPNNTMTVTPLDNLFYPTQPE